jgi:hypothetical protein
MSEEEFVEGAMEVGGLSESAAREAYHDPALALTVPVAVVVEDTAVSEPAAGNPTINAAYRGCTLTSKRDYDNVFGHRLFRWTVKKYWEGNGTTVRNVSHEVFNSRTWLGKEGNWTFNGLVEAVNEYRNWYGNWHGRHYSARTGQWKATAFEKRNLQVRSMTRADGSWTTDKSDGDCW